MSDRRLPLPGEQPRGVVRVRSRQHRRFVFGGRYGMTWLGVLVITALLVAMALWFAVQAFTWDVTLVVNGTPLDISTHRRTVAGVVRSRGIRLEDALLLEPAASTRIEDGMVISIGFRRPVVIHADGEVFIVESPEVDPRRLVAAADVALDARDVVRVDRADTAGDDVFPRELTVLRGKNLVVLQNGERTIHEVAAGTLIEALVQAGYVIREGDAISLPLMTSLQAVDGDTIEITLEQAVPVTVTVDDTDYATYTPRDTVSDVLADMGIQLEGLDYSIPARDAPITPGMQVRVVRVTEHVVTERAPIPFETSYVPDPDLELDSQRVLQEGRNGVLETRTRVQYEDGKEVSRAVEGDWVAEQPRERVIGYGTQIVIRELVTPEGTFHTWRTLRLLATSYSPSTADYKKPGDPFFGMTPFGIPLRRGIVAVDPRVINLKTNLYVDGYGKAQALDVGGAVKGFRIDLGYSDDDLVLWYNWVDVYLLLPVPPADEMIWILPERFQ